MQAAFSNNFVGMNSSFWKFIKNVYFFGGKCNHFQMPHALSNFYSPHSICNSAFSHAISLLFLVETKIIRSTQMEVLSGPSFFSSKDFIKKNTLC